jgi:type I restriction enzyme R subunit
MEQKAPQYLALIQRNFNDKDVDDLIEFFRDKDRRKEFFKEYKEFEMLYEIISPDAFLRPFMDDYATISSIYDVVRKAYTKTVYVDRAFQKKTNELVQSRVGTSYIEPVDSFIEINEETAKFIAGKKGGEGTKVINLIKSIEKIAEDESKDPFLIAMADRARAVQENYEDRQISTQDALGELLEEIQRNEARKKEQAQKGFDGLTFFVYRTLLDAGVTKAEEASSKIKEAFVEHATWQTSEAALRDLRQEVTFALYAEVDDLDKVTDMVDNLFTLLQKAYSI